MKTEYAHSRHTQLAMDACKCWKKSFCSAVWIPHLIQELMVSTFNQILCFIRLSRKTIKTKSRHLTQTYGDKCMSDDVENIVLYCKVNPSGTTKMFSQYFLYFKVNLSGTTKMFSLCQFFPLTYDRLKLRLYRYMLNLQYLRLGIVTFWHLHGSSNRLIVKRFISCYAGARFPLKIHHTPSYV